MRDSALTGARTALCGAGAIVEVYFGGEVVTWTGKATSHDVAIELASSGSDNEGSAAAITLDAWAMNASISGPPTTR